MIIHLEHDQIDPEAWDRRLAASANSSWYGTRAALDAAAPGWNALVDEDTGAQMPLPWRRKYGIRYVYQPFMLQHLGPYAPILADDLARRFLQALPSTYRYADVCVLGQEAWQQRGLRSEERTNHVLRLEGNAADLHAGYSTNHARSLRKAEQGGVSVERKVPAERVATFIESSDQFARWCVDAGQRAAMHRIMEATQADGSGFGRMAVHNGEAVAAGWFVRGVREVIFLKGVSSTKGRELRAMHALINDVIIQFAGSGLIFDLAGGNDPQLARFYSGFGAEPVLYLRALMNRLPPLVRRLKP